MNEDAINDIKNSVRQLLRHIVSRDRALSPDEKEQLRRVLEHADRRITELRQQGEQPPPEEPPRFPPPEPPIPYGADLLWQLARGDQGAFVQYLHSVPDPALNNLVTDPDRLGALIERLNRLFPPTEPIEIQGIDQAPLQSSNIWGFNYDPRSGHLKVRFQGGSVYEYEGVPPFIYNIFSKGAIPARTEGQNQYGRWWVGKNPSLGAAFWNLIRSGPYPYERVA